MPIITTNTNLGDLNVSSSVSSSAKQVQSDRKKPIEDKIISLRPLQPRNYVMTFSSRPGAKNNFDFLFNLYIKTQLTALFQKVVVNVDYSKQRFYFQDGTFFDFIWINDYASAYYEQYNPIVVPYYT